MKKIHVGFYPIFLLFVAVFQSASSQVAPWFNTETYNYDDIHDPSVLKDSRGVYTMMSTNNLLEVVQSTDLKAWTIRGKVFNNVPSWATQMNSGVGDLWAPHIAYMNGRYWAYYSASSFGSNNSGIGVASTATLDVAATNYGWTDHGMVIQSNGQNYNAIDPEVIQDQNGNWYMVFGSFWTTGIRMVQIDPATGKRLASNTTIYALADRNGGAIEGPSIVYNNGYYYLFVAYDACCQGASSTYRTMVGRSQSITGPYLDKAGTNMTNNAATEVIAAYDRFIGPGGGSQFKDGRRNYFAHHYYNGDQNGFPRVHFREIVWGSDGWPIFTQPYIGRRQAYEAEHAKLTSVVIADATNSSNGSYVNNINTAASRVVFHVNALQAGIYELHIRYATVGGVGTQFVAVNASEITVNYPATTNSAQFPQGQSVKVNITLNEGYNSLTFRQGTGNVQLDRIDLFRLASEVLEAGSNDDGVGVTYVPQGNNASLATGSWSKFEYLDFGTGGYNTLNITAGGNCNGTLDFSIDGINGTPNTATSINLTSGQSYQLSLPTAFSNLTNTHDVYYEYTGSQACILDKIQFSKGTIAVTDCKGVANGTATVDNCGICSGGTTGFQPCTGSIEAETACQLDGTVDNNNAGFSGTGFVNTNNVVGASVTWQISSNATKTATLSFKYANGGTADRNGTIFVNGVNKGVLTLAPTGAFTTWNTVTINVDLNQGNNLLKLISVTADGLANIDLIHHSSGLALLSGTCVVTEVQDTETIADVYLYPNPTNGIISIAGQYQGKWTLYDVLGVEILRGAEASFDINHLPHGIYYLKLETKILRLIKK